MASAQPTKWAIASSPARQRGVASTASAEPVHRATATDSALPPVARARPLVSASLPSVALRYALGYMLSPTSRAHMGPYFFKDPVLSIDPLAFLIFQAIATKRRRPTIFLGVLG